MSFTPRPTVVCDKCDMYLSYVKRESGDTVLLHPKTERCERSEEMYIVPKFELRVVSH